MTFEEYIIQERGQEFYDISKLDMSKSIVPHTLEQWFPDMYYDYKMLYDKDIKDLEIKYLKQIGEISSKLGYAEGILQGILFWDIPEELKDKIKESLIKIKEE